MDEAQQQRRADDRDRQLYARLDQQDKSYAELTSKFVALESSVNVVKIEQGHLKELFEARFKGLERGQELQIEKFDNLANRLLEMSQDAMKSPATRSLHDHITSVDHTCSQILETIETHKKIHTDLKTWQSNVETVLGILKWMGPMGVAGLIIVLLRWVMAHP